MTDQTRVPSIDASDSGAPTVKAYVVMFDRVHPDLRYCEYGPFWSRTQAEEWVADLRPVRQIVSWHIAPMGDPDREPRGGQ